MGNFVYKYVYDGEIIYIGKNDNELKKRIIQHKSEPKFKPYLNAEIYYISLANKAESKGMESLLINKYKPVLNVIDKYSSKSICELVKEPEWKRFDGETEKCKQEICETQNILIDQELIKLNQKLNSENSLLKQRLKSWEHKVEVLENNEKILENKVKSLENDKIFWKKASDDWERISNQYSKSASYNFETSEKYYSWYKEQVRLTNDWQKKALDWQYQARLRSEKNRDIKEQKVIKKLIRKLRGG